MNVLFRSLTDRAAAPANGATSPATNAKRETLSSVQALRGCAVLAVVCHHTFRTSTSTWMGSEFTAGSFLKSSPVAVELGATGVDVFFVLSGFLMILISSSYIERRRTVGSFLLHRIIRIWPLYAITTIYLLARMLVESVRFNKSLPFDFAPLRLAGLLFVPSFNSEHWLRPIYPIGWTLNYEIYFYLCFALAIKFAATKRELFMSVLILLFLGAVVGLRSPELSVARDFLANPVAFEFALGAAICIAFQARLLPLRPAVWFAAAAIWLALFAHIPADDGWRLGTRGIPAAFAFIAMLKLESERGFPAWLLAIGNASYSIYLVHALVLQVFVDKAMWHLRNFIPSSMLVEISSIIAAVAAVGAGLACYHVLELPLLARCRKWARL